MINLTEVFIKAGFYFAYRFFLSMCVLAVDVFDKQGFKYFDQQGS